MLLGWVKLLFWLDALLVCLLLLKGKKSVFHTLRQRPRLESEVVRLIVFRVLWFGINAILFNTVVVKNSFKY